MTDDKLTYINYNTPDDAGGDAQSNIAYDATKRPMRITQMEDASGNEVVKYAYDAWGNLLYTTGTLAGTLGYYNPFRYRGYIYDEETGLYYLRSRYYNPEWGRFLNADSYMGDIGYNNHNVFSYCYNSPIKLEDQHGKWGVTNDNVNLKENLNREPGATSKLTNEEFIIYLKKMVEGEWNYDKKGDNFGMREGYVDCVSVYRYIMQHYYNAAGYMLYLPKKGRNSLDNVTELVGRGVNELQDIAADYSNLVQGMAIFSKDSDGNYQHVAYYIGDGKAIESNVKTRKYDAGVHVINMTDCNFSECAYLNGLEYLDWR